jgi:hypothetical protein
VACFSVTFPLANSLFVKKKVEKREKVFYRRFSLYQKREKKEKAKDTLATTVNIINNSLFMIVTVFIASAFNLAYGQLIIFDRVEQFQNETLNLNDTRPGEVEVRRF